MARESRSTPRALTIAGSDSGGGAGIQADLKTFSALGVYGASVITAVTAQNTCTVSGIEVLPPAFIALQLETVLEDIGSDAAKTGMLATAAVIHAVAGVLAHRPIEKLVIDPVMVAKSGDALLDPEACGALIEELLPLAYMVTPNVPEAEILSRIAITSIDGMRAAGEKIFALGPRHVLMKGGHLDGEKVMDLLFDGKNWTTFEAERINTRNTHGTGCTYAAAIAAFLARGLSAEDAVSEARDYVQGAIRAALDIGKGHGPLNHIWRNGQTNQ